MKIRFWLDVIPRTKKNSQQIHLNSRTGRPFVSQSKAYKNFAKECAWLIPKTVRCELDVPCRVQTIFYMPTKRRVDLNNLISAIHDVLVENHVIKDDNCTIINNVDGSRVHYEQGKVGIDVLIEVLEGEQP